MFLNKYSFLIITLFVYFFINTHVYAVALKSCSHNGIIFDVIDTELDCFFGDDGELNGKMQDHHKTGWLETSQGAIYSPKIQLHGKYTKDEKDQDMHDPNCIPREIIISPGSDQGE